MHTVDLAGVQQPACELVGRTVPGDPGERSEVLVPHSGEAAIRLEPDDAGLARGLLGDGDRLTHGGEGSGVRLRPVDAAKEDLHHYLQVGREALVWKLEGLSEYDIRRPMTPTGTNLLGLVKHAAGVELGYFGEVFGRPIDEPWPWFDEGADPNADMWATPEESRDDIVALYRRAWTHADATIDALPLDALGSVAWWPEERREVTLHLILVHVIAGHRPPRGHADIIRELIDGAAGLSADNSNLPPAEQEWWASYRDQLEHAAEEAHRLWS